jgi:hypothetical protein
MARYNLEEIEKIIDNSIKTGQQQAAMSFADSPERMSLNAMILTIEELVKEIAGDKPIIFQTEIKEKGKQIKKIYCCYSGDLIKQVKIDGGTKFSLLQRIAAIGHENQAVKFVHNVEDPLKSIQITALKRASIKKTKDDFELEEAKIKLKEYEMKIKRLEKELGLRTQ